MAIPATSNSAPRELIPAGNYIARCYQMIHIGTVPEEYMGQKKMTPKARIGWELPTELKVFKQENGEQPCVISEEFSLYLNEKANLRKMLAAWRGRDFTEDEAKNFDITKLLGVPCMLNIIHKPSKDGTKMYEKIAGVTPLAKGVNCPPQINPTLIFEHENPDMEVFNKLPDFIKAKIMLSEEWTKRTGGQGTDGVVFNANDITEPLDEAPF